ncbi:MAG: hypothetical protein Q8Q59_04980 [Luteolibacter sp.]|jgi:hypothetical protein|nr:hypothetical protein [Luteolibacter sp.]
MNDGGFSTLASIEAIRPVFLIVMGVFLLLIAWRMSRTSDAWTARILLAGALLLAFGYSLLLPLYEAGVLEMYSSTRLHYQGSAAAALGWHIIKLVVMNIGWLAFGTGLAMHAKIFRSPEPVAHTPACSGRLAGNRVGIDGQGFRNFG